jgi:hypothetical protein
VFVVVQTQRVARNHSCSQAAATGRSRVCALLRFAARYVVATACIKGGAPSK